MFAQNIDCDYQQSMFLNKNKKNRSNPPKPSLIYIKVGFKHRPYNLCPLTEQNTVTAVPGIRCVSAWAEIVGMGFKNQHIHHEKMSV